MLSNDNVKFGYNAATGKYEDLMAAGIIDPTKVSCLLAYINCLWLANRSMNLSMFYLGLGCEMLLGTRSFGCKDILDV